MILTIEHRFGGGLCIEKLDMGYPSSSDEYNLSFRLVKSDFLSRKRFKKAIDCDWWSTHGHWLRLYLRGRHITSKMLTGKQMGYYMYKWFPRDLAFLIGDYVGPNDEAHDDRLVYTIKSYY